HAWRPRRGAAATAPVASTTDSGVRRPIACTDAPAPTEGTRGMPFGPRLEWRGAAAIQVTWSWSRAAAPGGRGGPAGGGEGAWLRRASDATPPTETTSG